MLLLRLVVTINIIAALLVTVAAGGYSAFVLKLEDDMTICTTKQEVVTAVNKAVRDKELLVVYASKRLASDGYASLYAGWLRYIFLSTKFKLRMLFVDAGSEENFQSITSFTFSVLPRESVFASFDHGNWVRRPKELGALKAGGRIADFGLFHLNHEQPWVYNVSNIFHNDYVDEEALVEHTYHKHSLVFRNYFSSRLDSESDTSFKHGDMSSTSMGRDIVQLPVGPSYYNYWIGNPVAELDISTPASQRPITCRFVGRQKYADVGEYSIPMRDALFTVAGATMHEPSTVFDDDKDDARALAMGFENVMDEVGKLAMYRYDGRDASSTASSTSSIDSNDASASLSSSSFPCQVFVYPRNIPLNYEFYMKILIRTAFVPCPPGNNPETFRHYEVLETGGIPLILDGRVVPHSDYLESKLWSTFPAPTFDSWESAGLFVERMLKDPVAVDTLQQQVQVWYHEHFKPGLRMQIEDAVAKHYPSLIVQPALSEDTTTATASASASTGTTSTPASQSQCQQCECNDRLAEMERMLESQREQTTRLQLLLSELREVSEMMITDVGTLHGGLVALMDGHNIFGNRISKVEGVLSRLSNAVGSNSANAAASIASGNSQTESGGMPSAGVNPETGNAEIL